MTGSKRQTILTQSEIAEFHAPPTLSATQRQHFFELNPLEEAFFRRQHQRTTQAYFVLMLGYFKAKACLLDFSLTDVKDDLDYVCRRYFNGDQPERVAFSKQQRHRLYREVIELTSYTPFDHIHLATLQSRTHAVAAICVEPRYLFDECLEYLSANRIIRPRYSVLQKIVVAALSRERQRCQLLLATKLTSSTQQRLLQLIQSSETGSLLTALKTLPKDFTQKELRKEIDTFNLLKPLHDEVSAVMAALNLSHKNVDYYASLVEHYTITKLRQFDSFTAMLYLVCYIFRRYRQIHDNLVNAFIYLVRKLSQEAAAHARVKAYESLRHVDAKLKQAGKLLMLFVDDRIDGRTPFAEVRRQAFSLLSRQDIPVLSEYLRDMAVDAKQFEWEFYDGCREDIQSHIRALFICLQFAQDGEAPVLMQQIEHSQLDFANRVRHPRCDKRLIGKALKPYLLKGYEPADPAHEATVHTLRYEMLLYQLITDSITGGKLHVPRSQQFRRLKDDLVSDAVWQDKPALIAASNLARLQLPVEQLLAELEAKLEERLNEVSARIASGDNHAVVFTDRGGQVKWRLPYRGSDDLVNHRFFDDVPQVHIADLLAFAAQQTGFHTAFSHIQTRYHKSQADLGNIIACIVANGTNYGLYRMAAISDRSLDHLRSAQAAYLRLETLQDANDLLSNAIAQLPVFRYYTIQQGVTHASADGQKFETRWNAFKARYSSKYFGRNKGVSSMTLVANHVPVQARLIGANEHESHYVFDLLYNNTSEIRPDILSTDTHGCNQVNFALLDLFGYTFAPRYASIGKIINTLFTVSKDDGARLLNLKQPIRRDVIVKGWDDVQRVAISLQQKHTTQAILVRKLSSYPASHPTLQALVEYDRLIKCLYILDYIDDISLRRYVQRALNRGEAYHQLRRAVAQVNGNRFRGGSDNEMALWNECARLITNAIIYFNSAILSKLLRQHERRNDQQRIEQLKRVSPVAWVNVNLNGTYEFAVDGQTLDLEQLLRDGIGLTA